MFESVVCVYDMCLYSIVLQNNTTLESVKLVLNEGYLLLIKVNLLFITLKIIAFLKRYVCL